LRLYSQCSSYRRLSFATQLADLLHFHFRQCSLQDNNNKYKGSWAPAMLERKYVRT